ncbi:type II toxin-antitoxin system RelE/ParE family toxin [Ferrovibrio sp.]|uniref:type II toxin-antitoxin system RelE family toxin n=1 Tax=Ferrovibrio sp. TaxID=1917215 RepID=UPI0025BB8C92|nr:type II toxin-antitoxin system RelE/ParE family toxin [Ferrovibrio sp.]MBX3453524.1 type II toxin-antitoxin system RelE/ParE family toxin [Ferrovibrio sp.]
MAWTIEFSRTAEKQIAKLDRRWQREILDYLDQRVARQSDPTQLGKPLRGDMKGLWRYRIGDFRVICSLEADRLVVHVVGLGHRSAVYE